MSAENADKPVFYYDFGSPYAYLAAARIDELIPDAEWRPIAFPAILIQEGRLEKSLSRDFEAVLAETSERARQRGLPPVTPPDSWPRESWSLTPLRAALFAEEQGRLREFSELAFRKVFADARSLAEPGNLDDVARDAGLDPSAVGEAVQRPDIKERLKERTNAALARGVTGIPTIEVGGELFWGDDHLEEAAAAAGKSEARS